MVVLDQVDESSPGQLWQHTRRIISHIPSRPHLIRDLRTDRMGGPESDQQAVQVMPLVTDQSLEPVRLGAVVGLQGDLLKVLGFDGLERFGDPPHARLRAQKLQSFEFRSRGEVNRSCCGRIWVLRSGIDQVQELKETHLG